CRTGEHDDLLPSVEPRAGGSPDDLSDDDLSFSRAPSPPPSVQSGPKFSPSRPLPPEEEVIVEEEGFIEPEIEVERSEPLDAAIAKVEPDESIEEIIEEEKAMEDEEGGEGMLVSEIGAEERPRVEEPEEDFMDLGPYEPREPSRGDRRGGRGGRDRGDRGG